MCTEEKCEAADPTSGAKEKQRVRKQTVFLHSAYPFFIASLNGQTYLPIFVRWWDQHTALMEAEPCVAVGSFQLTVRHS